MMPGKTYYFILRYSPTDVRNYSFDLPITLQGFGKIKSLKRRVICIGDKKPRFLINPTKIEFEKRIITSTDKQVACTKEVEVTNLGHKPLNWFIDTSKLQKENSVFSIVPDKGLLEYSIKAFLKVSFKPIKDEVYQVSVPVYLDDDLSRPYLELIIKGEGAYP